MHLGIRAACAVMLAGSTLGFATMGHADPLRVKVAEGEVQGKTINKGKVRSFLGLPYAAPPVGDLRWRSPQPPAKWSGIRDATHYGARCYQGQIYGDMIFQDSGPSEDCLYLNVFTPADATDTSKLPVMFWIHGGGYSGGSASEPRHNGDFLPTKGVVLVTINYRLGVLGFLATSELAKEADTKAGTGPAAGNYGLQDMVAALRWVRANIANFGGDPSNVTIFGESAGSFAVSTLMASPMAKGLFHKAIGESGAAFPDTQPMDSLGAREKRDEQWAASLGADSLAQLRAMPAEALIEAGRKPAAPSFSPVVDGLLLTEPIPETYAIGRQAHVPLLAGWNRDENSGRANSMTAAAWKAWATTRFGEHAQEFLRLYPGDTDEQAARSAIDYDSDTWIVLGTWKWIEAHRRTGDAPVYRYHFELAAPPSKFHSSSFAFHSDDIEYVFGTIDTRPGAVWGREDRKLSDEIMTYWTNFAKTGNPNGPGLPEWPRFGADKRIIHLDSKITSGPSTIEDRYEFLVETPGAAGR
jgi:para-nitrobenzyl esterase